MSEGLPTIEGLRGRLSKDHDMSGLSWLRVGGPAEYLFQPADADDLALFLRALPGDVPVFPIGVCSNLIIRDGGLDGVVIRLGRGFGDIEIRGQRVIAGAAALDARVAKAAAEAGIDLAFLRTIPGTLGGAVKMNAGCYGVYTADVFVEAEAVLRSGARVVLGPDDLDFAYRSSALPDDAVLTSITLEGPPGAPDAILRKMEEALERRAATQPVNARSCGSTFRNPSGFSSTGQEGDVHDLKAWKVIDAAGQRGAALGGAQMSPMHPNFLINTGDATARDLEELGELVRKRVFETSGIWLEWEIKRVGKSAPNT